MYIYMYVIYGSRVQFINVFCLGVNVNVGVYNFGFNFRLVIRDFLNESL